MIETQAVLRDDSGNNSSKLSLDDVSSQLIGINSILESIANKEPVLPFTQIVVDVKE